MQFGSWIGIVETNSNGKLLENRENIESNKNSFYVLFIADNMKANWKAIG